MKNIFNFLLKTPSQNETNFKIQSFTFFIPSPPARATGYREKQFDKIFYDFINKGFKIISINTQACNSSNQSGMWVICIVQALNEVANELALDEIFHDKLKNNFDVKKNVEGLYYIQDLSNDHD